jgi:hypothetical protein
LIFARWIAPSGFAAASHWRGGIARKAPQPPATKPTPRPSTEADELDVEAAHLVGHGLK